MLTYNFWENIRYKDNPKMLDILKHKSRKGSVVINLNFAENNKHGCKFGCKFCVWSELNYNKYVYPTDDDVLSFINKYADKSRAVRICGGGDPLFNFDENKEKLKHLIDLLYTNGYKVQMTTKDISTLYSNCDSKYLANVSEYSLSVETCGYQCKQLISKLILLGKYVRITKILNFSVDTNLISLDSFKAYIDFYNNDNPKLKICFRTNYLHPLNNDKIHELWNLFTNYMKDNNYKSQFSLNGNGPFKMLQLTNSEVSHCSDIEEQLLWELGKTVNDYGDFFKDYIKQ